METTVSAVDDFFEHFGVKGMKWGQRRKRGSDGRVGGSEGTSKSKGGSETASKPKAGELSTTELQHHIARMQLEKQYSDLVKGVTPQKKSEAGAFIADLGKTLVKNAVTTTGSHAVKMALEKSVKK